MYACPGVGVVGECTSTAPRGMGSASSREATASPSGADRGAAGARAPPSLGVAAVCTALGVEGVLTHAVTTAATTATAKHPLITGERVPSSAIGRCRYGSVVLSQVRQEMCPSLRAGRSILVYRSR